MGIKKVEGFCTVCGSDILSFEGLSGCPNCDTKSVPCSYDKQVNISINWHELRLLVMWAENWYNHSLKDSDEDRMNVVFSIAERIRRQHPDLSKDSPLTMAEEFQKIVDMFPGAIHNMPGVEGGNHGES